MKTKTPSLKKRLLTGVLILFIMYACTAVLPYAFPPHATEIKLPAWEETETSSQWAAILESGEEALWGRLYLIENAKEKIRLSSYLYACDDSGKRIGAALIRAAERGVDVEILVDGLIGRINFGASPLAYALGSHENIRIRLYNPVDFLRPDRLNARLHDKYLIADDRMMILGGRNISDEFLTKTTHPAYNFDRDVMLFSDEGVSGSGVDQLAAYFDSLWQGEYVQPAYEKARDAAAVMRQRQEMEKLLLETEREKTAWFRKIEHPGFSVPVEGCQLITNPVHPGVKAPVVFDHLCAMIAEAEERVILQSPYFVLDGRMQTAMQQAVSGPAQVMFYTNSMAGGNNLAASADYLWQKEKVLAIGAPLYELQTEASVHTKSMLVDRHLSVFGSFNFDMRSAYIDTEVMMAVYGEALNERLYTCMENMAEQALLVTEEGYAEDERLVPLELPEGKKWTLYLLSPVMFLIRHLL